MRVSSVAAVAVLLPLLRPTVAQGNRHSSSNKLRHIRRSPWGDSPAPPAYPVYGSCVEQCMGVPAGQDGTAYGSTGGDAANQPDYASSAAVAPTPDAYGSPSLGTSTLVGVYGALSDTVSSVDYPSPSSPSVVPGGGYSYGSSPSSSPAWPSTTSTTTNTTADTGIVAGPYQVVVAPKKGDLRMVPFNIKVPQGKNVTFIWGAGPHTVTQSSPLEICNASLAQGAFKSGMQNASFQFPVQVSTNSTQTYFCNVPGHCQKGMFGLINGETVAVPEGSFGEAMPQMAANNPDFMTLWNETKTMCQDSPEAWAWGDNLATSQLPDWALPAALENILLTRQFLATNPPDVGSDATNTPSIPSPSGSPAVSSATSSTSSNDANPATPSETASTGSVQLVSTKLSLFFASLSLIVWFVV
ncbi:hypothetical protein JCM16303_001766 [Sporobolomyces ruberrimus]